MMTWGEVIACVCNTRVSETKSLPLSLLQQLWNFGPHVINITNLRFHQMLASLYSKSIK